MPHVTSQRNNIEITTDEESNPVHHMQFKIGAWTWRVKRKFNLTYEGERCDGLAASTSRTIWLDGTLKDEVIESVLRHEHTHAWQFEVGTPATFEDQASFTATIGASFQEEFERQGGLPSLLEIPIEGSRRRRRSRCSRPICPKCGAKQRRAQDRTFGFAGVQIRAGDLTEDLSRLALSLPPDSGIRARVSGAAIMLQHIDKTLKAINAQEVAFHQIEAANARKRD